MAVEQAIIDEMDLRDQQVEPSERFARLLMRVGGRTGIGSLGLDAIRKSVRDSVDGQ